MPAQTQTVLNIEELVAKFKERKSREPRNASELTQFSKQLRDIKPITYSQARKYFRKDTEQKETDEKNTEEDEEPQPAEIREEEPTATEEETTLPPLPFEFGDDVTLTKDRTGTVRFVGEVTFADGIWYGIELHEPFAGKCDGTKDKKRYFECGDNRGIFVQEAIIRRKMNQHDYAKKESWQATRHSRESSASISDSAGAAGEDIIQKLGGVEEEKETEDAVVSEETEAPSSDPMGTIVVEDLDAEQPEKNDEEPPINNEDSANENFVVLEEPADDAGSLVVTPSQSVRQPLEIVKSVHFDVEEVEYYPAKEGENVLQFLANQFDLDLRSELMDFYMKSATAERVQLIFETLKPFDEYEQKNLLLVDLLPRLRCFSY